ncbi:MAG: hypothetical protein M3336_12590 [Chloroflexota bacterium]|nr:hypothetical protein [Chloroflexota bacterium]
MFVVALVGVALNWSSDVGRERSMSAERERDLLRRRGIGDVPPTGTTTIGAATAPSVAGLAPAAAGEARTATASDHPSGPPEALRDTYLVSVQPVGCHQSPAEHAAGDRQLRPGVVHLVDARLARPDGTWYREAGQQCWVLAGAEWISIFTDEARAACFAAGVGRPPPLVSQCVVITTVTGGAAGEPASLLALVPPGARCTGNVLSALGRGFFVQELVPRDADRNGFVTWDWVLDPATPSGQSTVTVTCIPGGTGSAGLQIAPVGQ